MTPGRALQTRRAATPRGSLLAARVLAAPLLAALLLVAPLAHALAPVPALGGRVNDTVGLLPPARATALESKLETLEREKGSQVAVLIVGTTAEETIEQYAIRVAEAWKLGRAGVDDGALLLLAKDDRAVRIEVGYGLEGALPDAVVNRIIEEHMVPLFRSGDYAGGIEAGVDRVAGVIRGEPLPAPRQWTPQQQASDPIGSVVMWLFIATAIGRAVRTGRNRLSGAATGMLLAGGAGMWFTGALWIALVAGVVASGLVLMPAMAGMPGGLGRIGGGRTGGFGGGGGFSGGGGRFGGGGASGRW